MRIRRIIIFIATGFLCSSAAGANPFIEADPISEHGAATRLSLQIGGLRGSITADDIPVFPHQAVDPVKTQSVSRALTPAQWLAARSMIAQQQKASDAVTVVDTAIEPPKEPEAVPLEQMKRPVRIVYINNAPL